MITCEETWEYLSDYLDGELPSKMRRELKEHLEECPFCSALFNTLNKTLSLCQEEFFPFPSSLHQMIINSLREMKLLPEVDIVDKKDSILVKVVLPGVEKKDINISVRGDNLVIEAKVRASYKDGVLEITLLRVDKGC